MHHAACCIASAPTRCAMHSHAGAWRGDAAQPVANGSSWESTPQGGCVSGFQTAGVRVLAYHSRRSSLTTLIRLRSGRCARVREEAAIDGRGSFRLICGTRCVFFLGRTHNAAHTITRHLEMVELCVQRGVEDGAFVRYSNLKKRPLTVYTASISPLTSWSR